jgi:hypothetical protein
MSEWDAVSQAIIEGLAPAIDFLQGLGYIGEATLLVRTPGLDATLTPTAEGLGMDLTLFKYTLGLFAVYPFAFMLYHLPGKNLKHLFSLVVGLALTQWIYGADWIHTFASSLGTYFICLLCPKRYVAVAVFVFVMGYMTVSHIYRMYVSYLSGVFDFTGTQMVLTMKLTAFGYNLFDGTADKQRVLGQGPYRSTDNQSPIYLKKGPKEAERERRVLLARQQFAVEGVPNPLAFFGYVYCFTCLLAGPAFEYQDYLKSVDDSAFKVSPHGEVKRLWTILPALQRLLLGVVCMVGYLQLSGRYPLRSLYDAEFIASTPAFHLRLVQLFAAMFAERLKYYFAWKIAEGASIAGGFGFEGWFTVTASKDDSSKEMVVKPKPASWKGVENIDIMGFELAANMASATRAWNKRTQGWLERYTYLRSNKSLFMTYFISALWHGLYPGFFVVFLSMPLLTEVERLVRAVLNPLFVPGYDGRGAYPKGLIPSLYWAVSVVGTVVALNYTAQCFSFGSLERCLRALASLHYFGHIFALAAFVLLTVVSMASAGGKKKSSSSGGSGNGSKETKKQD